MHFRFPSSRQGDIMFQQNIPMALTFDDVLLVPGPSEILPSEVSLKTRLTETIELQAPLLSAAMDTVTEHQTAIAMAREGGIGIIHKNMSIESQAKEVERVKKSESGMIVDPITVSRNQSVAEVQAIMRNYRISGLPVLDGDKLVRCSRLSAKIDNTCINDGYQIYLHNFILTRDGKWAVVQQGMNKSDITARRYHWLSDNVKSFVDDPHSGIAGENMGSILNLSDTRSEPARSAIVEFLSIHPDKQQHEIESLISSQHLTSRHLDMPAHHHVTAADVNSKRMGAVLALAYEKQFRDFTDALLLNGVE